MADFVILRDITASPTASPFDLAPRGRAGALPGGFGPAARGGFALDTDAIGLGARRIAVIGAGIVGRSRHDHGTALGRRAGGREGTGNQHNA